MTNTAAAAAAITWVLASYLHHGKVSVVGAACGAVAGLVAITPASGFVTAGGAVIIGLLRRAHLLQRTLLRSFLKIDDALDVFAVHGVGGTFGAIATGVFATTAINYGSGLIDGNPSEVWTQIVAVGAIIAYAVVATFVIVKVTGLVLGIRSRATRRRSASISPSTARSPTSPSPSESAFLQRRLRPAHGRPPPSGERPLDHLGEPRHDQRRRPPRNAPALRGAF